MERTAVLHGVWLGTRHSICPHYLVGGGGCDPAPILHCCPSVSRAQSWMGRGGCFSPTPLIADCSLLFSSCMVRNEGLLCLQLQWHKGVLSSPTPPNTPVHPELWGTPTPLRSCVCDAHPHPIASILLPPSPTFPAQLPRGGGGEIQGHPPSPPLGFSSQPKVSRDVWSLYLAVSTRPAQFPAAVFSGTPAALCHPVSPCITPPIAAAGKMLLGDIKARGKSSVPPPSPAPSSSSSSLQLTWRPPATRTPRCHQENASTVPRSRG